jgi:hypothetical protein
MYMERGRSDLINRPRFHPYLSSPQTDKCPRAAGGVLLCLYSVLLLHSGLASGVNAKPLTINLGN